MNNALVNPADRLARALDVAFRDLLPGHGSPDVSTHTWMPPVDIRETAESLLVQAELPGLRKEDIDITLENNVLTLSGERRFEKDTKEKDYHRVERSYGSFARSFSLPSTVQADKVDATFKDGVLTIHIAKAEAARPRKISVK